MDKPMKAQAYDPFVHPTLSLTKTTSFPIFKYVIRLVYNEQDDDEVAVSGDDDDDADNKDDDDNDDDDQNDDNTDNEGDDQDDDNEQTKSDNDDDDIVHPKLSTFDEEQRKDEEDKEEVWYDDEASDEETQGVNVEEEELDEEETNKEDEVNELYRDVNINLEGRDTKMIDAPQTHGQGQQHSSSVSSGFVSNMLNPSPDTGIDSIFNLNTASASLVDVSVTTISETPLSSATTLPLPPIPLITHLQQTPVPTPATILSASQQDLHNFSSLFGFDHRLKTLENDFLECKPTNQFAVVVSSIPGIVDMYLANKMNEAFKTVVQLQSDRLGDKAQANNEDFINKLDDNIKKIIKEKVKEQVKAQVSKILPKIKKTVNEQLEAEVLTRSSNEYKTSHAVAANLSELELKKILIDKIERKSQFTDLCHDQDDDKEPSVGSNRGSKRRRAGKEPESTSAPKEKTSKIISKSTKGSKSHHKSANKSAQTEEPMHTTEDLEEPVHQEFVTGVTEDQPDEETSQLPNWFQKPPKPPTLDRDWDKTLPAAHGPVQPWLSTLAQKEDTHDSFNELLDTPLDFSAFVMNQLKVDTLTPELLAGLTFELMKGWCKSLVELEYFLEEVYKATTDQLD
ncbi:hypothetical protein Tco_0957462 [Tanacetum coccineum]